MFSKSAPNPPFPSSGDGDNHPRSESWLGAFREAGRNCISPLGLTLLLATLILIWQRHHQGLHTFSWEPIQRLLQAVGLPNPRYKVLEWFGLSLLSQLAVPILFIGLVLHRPLREYGLQFGKIRESLAFWGLCMIIMIPLLLITSQSANFQNYYPLFKPARGNANLFAVYELSYGAYFFSWEFLFRGFLLFSLEKYLGTMAIPVQMVPFSLMHLGKPPLEVYASVIAGLVLGFIALRTRSMLPCFLIHWSCALLLDIFVVFL